MITTVREDGTTPADLVQRTFAPLRLNAVGSRSHLRRDVERLRLRRFVIDVFARRSWAGAWGHRCVRTDAGRVEQALHARPTATGSCITGSRRPLSRLPTRASRHGRSRVRRHGRDSYDNASRIRDRPLQDEVIDGKGRGDRSRPWSLRPSRGSTGSIPDGCWRRWATCHRSVRARYYARHATPVTEAGLN